MSATLILFVESENIIINIQDDPFKIMKLVTTFWTCWRVLSILITLAPCCQNFKLLGTVFSEITIDAVPSGTICIVYIFLIIK